jgi:hypothetical protein
MSIVIGDPGCECADQFNGRGPVLPLQAFGLQGAHHPRGVRCARRVVITGEGLLDP